MTKLRLRYFQDNTEPIPARIAAGLQKIGIAMKQQTWQRANEEGLSATQGQILALLVAHGPLSAKDLSDRLGVTLPTLSDSVRVLLEKKLVTKSADARHPRSSLLTPTKRGAEVGRRARSWPEFMADAVGVLSPDEQRAFFSGIVRMIRSLQEEGLIPLHGMCVTCAHFRPNVRPGPSPHHCALVDSPLAGEQLRVDCPDHEIASEQARRQQWEEFVRPN
jgi:DNA-binding MarR family transcriptional regulator